MGFQHVRRWCFVDQLGPHFLDTPEQPVLLVESRAVFERRRFHRRKAHLVLSALRHRAAELGDQALFVVAGISTPTIVSHRRKTPHGWVLHRRGCPTRTRSTSRFAPTWTAGNNPARCRSSDATGPREFAVTRAEALAALDTFIRDHLAHFGAHEDAMMAADPWMSHSLLSATMNLGLLDPVECTDADEQAYRAGRAPLASVEGYIRQLIGWRDYIWHTYWHFGEAYRHRNALVAKTPVPDWFSNLEADAVEARCLREVLSGVRDHGWVHHIPRLMILANYALQQGWHPAEMTDWFHRCFVDGYDWVMVGNVVGMSQHADGGLIATKPYAAGGAYINRMSDYCDGCRYRPTQRVGEQACPFTGGYWSFLSHNRERLAANRRMARPLASMRRLRDLDEVVTQQRRLGSRPA
jgi:deoxyribodipyrimidine photolyase-like uncharacterized protein